MFCTLTCVPEKISIIVLDNSGVRIIKAITAVIATIRDDLWGVPISQLGFAFKKSIAFLSIQAILDHEPIISVRDHTCWFQAITPLRVEPSIFAITVIPVALFILQTI